MLDEDRYAHEKVSFGEIYLKLKKRFITTWSALWIGEKILYIIEYPIQLLM